MLPHLTLSVLVIISINIRVQMITTLEGNTGEQAWEGKLTARGNIWFSSDFRIARHLKPIPAAGRFKVYVCCGSLARIAGSNPVEGMVRNSRVYRLLRR